MNNTTLALLPLALAYIMFTLGAGLKLSDFRVIANNPKAFFVGLVNQVVFVPLVALAVVLQITSNRHWARACLYYCHLICFEYVDV